MRGGVASLPRRRLQQRSFLERRGYNGLSLDECRLTFPLHTRTTVSGRSGAQGQAASVAVHAATALGVSGACGQALATATRTSTALGSAGAAGLSATVKNAVNVIGRAGAQGTAASVGAHLLTALGAAGAQGVAASASARASAMLGATGAAGQAVTIVPVTLGRVTSGIIFYDDFNRSDRALNGDNGWVDDANTWSIVSNEATSSGQNFARCRNTGMTPTADGIWEARVKSPAGIYNMLRLLAPSSSDDYHIDLHLTDKRLAYAASSDTTLATLTLTMDNTNYHAIKVRYTATRNFVIWFDRVAVLGSLGSPFNVGAGPTAAGVVGMMGYGGAPLFDWVLVSSDHLITVTGLSGTQGFRLFDSGASVIGSSAAQSGGSATLSLATLVDGLTTGFIQVYDDAGTWAVVTAGGRYPSSGDATDIAGGDSYLLL